ncbi:MFS transporter [Nostoc sp.]|uniref:MFS transporter n=1 Tax=Nostoc sp. TaxID=1180 RepID=UPI002FFC5FC5
MVKHPIAIGMGVFTWIWVGQLVSLSGSSLTNFALSIWVYQRTGSVTQFALMTLSATLPAIVFSPIAGALVDRWNRKWAMIVGDAGAGIIIGAITLLLTTDRLEIWQLYLATVVGSTFSTFQWLAYSTAITLLVPKQHLGRACGMIQLAEAVAQLISPVLGGVLLSIIQLQGITLVDFTTFLFSLVTLLSVRVPDTKTTAAGQAGAGSLLREAAVGWNYITARLGLLGLLLFFAISNFLMGIFALLFTPLVLSFASTAFVGIILSLGGISTLMGTLVMSTWGRSQRLIHTILSFEMLSGLCILVAGLRTSVPLLSVATFLFFFGLPIISGSNQIIWQRKVAPDVQGRVFAVRRMITLSSRPIACLVAGPLADQVFDPLMAPNGPLAGSIGQIIGVGSGRGIGLLFIIIGALTMLATIAAYHYSPLRLVENELPDPIADDLTK